MSKLFHLPDAEIVVIFALVGSSCKDDELSEHGVKWQDVDEFKSECHFCDDKIETSVDVSSSNNFDQKRTHEVRNVHRISNTSIAKTQ